MKTPRVTDFDPNAQIPTLGSPMDNFPPIQKPHDTPVRIQEVPEREPQRAKPVLPVRVVLPEPPVPLVRPVRDVPPIRRVMKQRHPFDIYHDQYEALQQLALEERKQGGVGSMSAMVREALDTFITAKRRIKK